MDAAGGGGYGDPAARDAEALARDVREGKVSRECARHDYGAQDEQTVAKIARR
jgi:N-methylhydantoinase B